MKLARKIIRAYPSGPLTIALHSGWMNVFSDWVIFSVIHFNVTNAINVISYIHFYSARQRMNIRELSIVLRFALVLLMRIRDLSMCIRVLYTSNIN